MPEWLLAACNSWEADGFQDAAILIAAATPNGAQIVRAEAWPPDEYSYEGAAEALIAAVEGPPARPPRRPSSPRSPRCSAAPAAPLICWERREIRASGETPMLAVMIAGTDIVAATTLCVPRPVLH